MRKIICLDKQIQLLLCIGYGPIDDFWEGPDYLTIHVGMYMLAIRRGHIFFQKNDRYEPIFTVLFELGNPPIS